MKLSEIVYFLNRILIRVTECFSLWRAFNVNLNVNLNVAF